MDETQQDLIGLETPEKVLTVQYGLQKVDAYYWNGLNQLILSYNDRQDSYQGAEFLNNASGMKNWTSRLEHGFLAGCPSLGDCVCRFVAALSGGSSFKKQPHPGISYRSWSGTN
jgi:hypothetical protein